MRGRCGCRCSSGRNRCGRSLGCRGRCGSSALRCSHAVLDVTDLAIVRAKIGAAEPFDILVNNAGTNRPAPFLEVKIEDFEGLDEVKPMLAEGDAP